MKKLKKLETHGKVEDTKPTTLEQIWGYNELSRYGTLDVAEYKNKLQDMTRADLENHARRLGVLVVESSARLREKLITEFKSYASLLRKPNVPTGGKVNVTDAVKDVLAEGR
jgi:hypothetical protein